MESKRDGEYFTPIDEEHIVNPNHSIDEVRSAEDAPVIGEVALRSELMAVPKAEANTEAATETSGGGPTESKPKEKKPVTEPRRARRRRGHPMKQVKEHLAQTGRLNAQKPMPPEQKKARRRKRKK